MRLGDLDALKVVYQKWMSELDENNPEYADERNAILSCICQLEDQPSIDPESLPIVRQLRAELEQAVAVRDAPTVSVRDDVQGQWLREPSDIATVDIERCSICGCEMNERNFIFTTVINLNVSIVNHGNHVVDAALVLHANMQLSPHETKTANVLIVNIYQIMNRLTFARTAENH